MAANGFQPTVRARRVACEMRSLRLYRNMTVEEVAGAIGWHADDYRAAEVCQSPLTAFEASRLLAHFGVSADYRDYFVGLAAAWDVHDWTEYLGGSTPPHRRMFFGLNRFTGHNMVYHPLVVPGLLQTRGYAEALAEYVLHPGQPRTGSTVDYRMVRRDRIRGDENGLRVSAVIGECAFHVPIANAPVMVDQIDYLSELTQLPHVDIRVLPATRGEHVGFPEAFTILQYPETPDADITCVEHQTRALFLDVPDEVDDFHLCFQRLSRAACGVEETRALLDTLKFRF